MQIQSLEQSLTPLWSYDGDNRILGGYEYRPFVFISGVGNHISIPKFSIVVRRQKIGALEGWRPMY